MSTLVEIEAAADALSHEQQQRLLDWLAERMRTRQLMTPPSHSILDIPTVSIGAVLRLPQADDDTLGEMLEERK